MGILFEKLYGTYSGGTTQICFIHFLEQDQHIFHTNILFICDAWKMLSHDRCHVR